MLSQKTLLSLNDHEEGKWYKSSLVFLARVSRKITSIGLTLIAIPIVLLSRVLQPIVLIRYGYFTSERIGHFVFDVALYLSNRARCAKRKFSLDLFGMANENANSYFLELSRRYIRINRFNKYLYDANLLIPFGDKQTLVSSRQVNGSRDMMGIMAETEIPIEFSREDEEVGNAYLRSIGCSSGTFACLIVRDQAYLSTHLSGGDWSYHSFRDSLIGTYRNTAIELANRGYFVIRMGKHVAEKFNVEHPNIIDYATSGQRSDFLDIWLMARCQFAISTGTGTDIVTNVFKKPVVYVNFLPAIDYVSFVNNITVFKKLTWKDTNQCLSLEEMLEHSYDDSDSYAKKGIAILDLTSAEIKDVVIELVERISGKWVEGSLDKELQDQFLKILRASKGFSKWHGYIHPEARYGSSFLRKNNKYFLH